MTLTPTNDNRPAAFDAALLGWRPLLSKVAAKLVPHDQREELVQDTLVYGMQNWRTYNNRYSLGGWLVFKMRGIASNMRRVKKLRQADAAMLDRVPVAQQQEDITYANQVLEAIPVDRRAVMHKIAAGCHNREAGASIGVGAERARQIAVQVREHLKRVAA